MKTVGEKIKEIRLNNSLTQQDFSKSLGISRPHLSKIESGKENASDSVLRLISELYNINYDYLCSNDECFSFSMDIKGLKINHDLQKAKTANIAIDILNNIKVKDNSKKFFIENIGNIYEAINKFYNRVDIENCNLQDVEIVCAYIEKKMLCALDAFKNENLDEKIEQ